MSEWINCSDALPEEGVYVLVAMNEIVFVETHFWENDCITDSPAWFSANEGTEVSPIGNFTHWMPLPQPPTD